MFHFFIENEVISSNHSGFKPGDSWINQAVSITHEIYIYIFDEIHEDRNVFFDISKAFNKVWHDGIVFNLIQKGISGNLLNLLREFLSERRRSVVFKSQFSYITAGVPQGSILGTWMYLMCINDLSERLSTQASTATLWQRCHNVVVDVVTTLWHGRKWELYRRQDVASTLLQRRHNIKH